MKTLIYVILLFLNLPFQADAQLLSTFNYTDNIFLPNLQNRYDLKLAFSKSKDGYNENSYYQIAFLPFKNIVIKFSKNSGHSYDGLKKAQGADLLEVAWSKNLQFSIGYIITKKKIQMLNSFLQIESYLSYSKTIFTNTQYWFCYDVKCSNISRIEIYPKKYSSDFTVYLRHKYGVELSTNFRMSLIDYNKTKQTNNHFGEVVLQERAVEFIRLKNPFLGLESNFKINYNFNNMIDIFVKSNHTLGRRKLTEAIQNNVIENGKFEKLNHANLTGRTSLTFGLAVNPVHFVKLINMLYF